MRTPLIMAALLTIALAAQSQTGLFSRRPSIYPSRETFLDCAEALPRLYDRRDLDSIALFVRQRIRTSPGFQSDLYALHILLDIQRHRFSPDSLQKDPNLYFALDAYVRDLAASQSDDGYSGIYAASDFDARPSYQQEFAVLAQWAEDLLETRRLSNAEFFFCQVFAGDFEHPRKTARADKVRYWQINSMFDVSAVNGRKAGSLTLYFGAGVWIPLGKLALFGVHPSITSIGVGRKNWSSEWDVTLAHRFANTAHPYTVLRQDSTYSVNHFLGGYFGLDYTRYLIHAGGFEAGALVGAGYDGFDVNDKYSNDTPVGPPPPTSINSLNLNFGCRINYYFDPKHYIGVVSRYNIIQYSNPGGTPLDGNAITIDLIVGFN